MKIKLYLNALRVAKPRQLRARVTRPARRLWFPSSRPPRRPVPLPQAESLWRSLAFEPSHEPPHGTRLARFHRNYGEDVLAATRAGDLESARARLSGWIEQNPPRNDDAWHPYVLSTRVGNWIAALTLLPALESPAFTDLLWRQLMRLKLSVEDEVLGNHLIRNARAFALGGATFGEPELTERALALLARELPEQVLADGGHYERSPVYHLIVLRDLIEIEAVTGEPSLAPVIERMRVFAAAMQRPDGLPALFNDGWFDLAPQLELPNVREGLTVLRESGFAVVRDGLLWLAFRCGPLAPPFLPAHAHADALSFQLWWRGEPVVADPGSFTYEPGPDRNWFRGTRAHSTVAIDGRDQFEFWGAFRAGPLPAVELIEARDGLLEAAVRLDDGLRHFRRIEWNGSEVSVRDRVEGWGTHRIESRLIWAPGARERVIVEAEGTVRIESERAWIAERFGERLETKADVLVAERELPTELAFRIRCLE